MTISGDSHELPGRVYSTDIGVFLSFEAAFNDDPQKQHMRRFLERFREDDGVFKSLLHFKRIYVIAEPGYGKTRLLREVVRHAPAFGKEAIFIDLKKVVKEKLVETIENQAKIYAIKTDHFELANDEKLVFCFDALDEIQADAFSYVIEQLRFLVSEFNNASFIRNKMLTFRVVCQDIKL